MRRTFLAVLILAACRHGAYYVQSHLPRDCAHSGTACINPTTLYPLPEPIHLKPGDWANFYFTDGNNVLKVESDVLVNTGSTPGHAWGQVRGDAVPYSKHKYSIIDVTANRRNDPTIIIDPHG
jgi:hypothetical protein